MNSRGIEPGRIDNNYTPEVEPEVAANSRGIVPSADGLDPVPEKPAPAEEVSQPVEVPPVETRTAAEDTRSRSSDQADTPATVSAKAKSKATYGSRSRKGKR